MEDSIPPELVAQGNPLVALSAQAEAANLLPAVFKVLQNATLSPGASALTLSILPAGKFFSPQKYAPGFATDQEGPQR